MKQKIRSRILGVTFASLGLFHVAMTAVYLSPSNLFKLAVEKPVHAYMAPLFYQDWHLFSPNPGISSTQLWIRCKALGDKWSDWSDPFAEVQAAHYRNRFTGRGKLLYVYRGIGSRLLEKNDDLRSECRNCTDEAIAKKLRETSEFKLATRFASDFCTAATHSAPHFTMHEFKTVYLTPKRYSERNSPKKWGSVVERSYGKGMGI